MQIEISTKDIVLWDMDGTLNPFGNAEMDELMLAGYFRNRPLFKNVSDSSKILNERGVRQGVLSAVLSDMAMKEKQEWLDEFFPWIDKEDRFFVMCGDSKAQHLNKNGLKTFLIDDYTQNLTMWPKNQAIKMYNDINGSNNTWDGYSIRYNMDPIIMANQIQGIILVA